MRVPAAFALIAVMALMADDFWGSAAWAQWAEEIGRGVNNVLYGVDSLERAQS
jgi:hypothetical protein